MAFPFETGWKKKTSPYAWVFSCLILASLAAASPALAQGRPTFDSVEIGALDPDAWNGVVFLAKAYQQPAFFALRLGSRYGMFLDGAQVFDTIAELGPHAPDGSYCRIAWRQPPLQRRITLEWSRVNETTVVGRVTAPQNLQLVLETYLPFSPNHIGQGWAPAFAYTAGGWSKAGSFSLAESNQAIVGERFFDGVFGRSSQFVVMVDQPTIGSGTFSGLSEIREMMNASGGLISRRAPLTAEPAAAAAGLEFVTGNSSTSHFVATLGWDKQELIQQAKGWLTPSRIDSILLEKSDAYQKQRPSITGVFEGAPEAIGDNMLWSSIYASSLDLIFPSISRRWAGGWGGWVVGEWDCFFDSLLTSLEDKTVTNAGIKGILLSQTDAGLVPNAASGAGITPDRSQPPVGSYCVWKDYQRYHDRSILEWAYPRLVKWHEWWFKDRGDGQSWRDGNHDGLLEWGSDRGSAGSVVDRGMPKAPKWETGMDDSPMYDDVVYDEHTYTMRLDDIGLNSLYTLDAECLAKIAMILGRDEDSKRFTEQNARMKQLIREKLWNEKDGIYESRSWDGQFLRRLSPTNFYPMFAGIATPEQAERMVKEHLLNLHEFWGTYVIPSISRDDPAFQDQFYWRGSIWAPTNYMVYEGLKRYGYDRVSYDFAQKSYDLFMQDWRTSQRSNENYLAWGGNGAGDPHYTWGALLPLIATEEYIDENPWEGLRFGVVNPSGSGEFRGAIWENHTYDVTIGAGRTSLVRDGVLRIEADAGVVVRKYQVLPDKLSFAIRSEKPVRITSAEFGSGELELKIDGKMVNKLKVQEGRVGFDVPAGEREIELVRQGDGP